MFLAYCSYTVWLGECIPGTGTYANAYANQQRSLGIPPASLAVQNASELCGMATPADAGERLWIPFS